MEARQPQALESLANYARYEVKLLVERSCSHEPHRITNARDIYEFMSGLERESAEHVYELLMDTKHCLTGVYLVGKGGISQSLVDPKEVYKAAFVTNSPCFAVVHNHPSGCVEPSPDDKTLAARLANGARILDLDFLDFIIVGDGSYCSFRSSGLLP